MINAAPRSALNTRSTDHSYITGVYKHALIDEYSPLGWQPSL